MKDMMPAGMPVRRNVLISYVTRMVHLKGISSVQGIIQKGHVLLYALCNYLRGMESMYDT